MLAAQKTDRLEDGTRISPKCWTYIHRIRKEGQPAGLRDVVIGAIASTKGYSLATRNVEHFQKIKGLNLIPIH